MYFIKNFLNYSILLKFTVYYSVVLNISLQIVVYYSVLHYNFQYITVQYIALHLPNVTAQCIILKQSEYYSILHYITLYFITYPYTIVCYYILYITVYHAQLPDRSRSTGQPPNKTTRTTTKQPHNHIHHIHIAYTTIHFPHPSVVVSLAHHSARPNSRHFGSRLKGGVLIYNYNTTTTTTTTT